MRNEVVLYIKPQLQAKLLIMVDVGEWRWWKYFAWDQESDKGKFMLQMSIK